MLDTGIDVPEVVNLVFFKLVRSNTKFWQMIGRGTRLCPDLFGPNQDKQGFFVFDLCQNVEFFNQDLAPAEGRLAPSLGQRLFTRRANLIVTLDHQYPHQPPPVDGDPNGTQSNVGLRWDTAHRLHQEVTEMNPNNFLIRSHRQHVDFHADFANWHTIGPERHAEVTEHLAPLPTAFREDENGEEAKRFDLLVLRLQLAHLGAEPGYDRLRDQGPGDRERVAQPTNIPAVRA
jgi:type I restriction enzyme R subunit